MSRLLYGTVNLTVAWCSVRIDGGRWRARAWRALGRAEAAWRWASLLHLLAFLRRGRYRSPAERALRMRLVYDRPDAPRLLSFDLLNRELVWSGFTELLARRAVVRGTHPIYNNEKRLRFAHGYRVRPGFLTVAESRFAQ